MALKIRLSGEPDEIGRLVEHLRERFDVAGGDRTYPNRGSFGVRAYLELREHSGQKSSPQRVQSERIQPNRQEVEP